MRSFFHRPCRAGSRRLGTLLLWAVLMSLAACATPPAPSQRALRQSVPAMRHILSRSTQAGGLYPGAWPEANWWRVFHNQDLGRLMQAALHDNPDLRIVQSRLRAAQEIIRARGSALLPKLDATARFAETHYARDSIHGALNGQRFLYSIINPLDLSYHVDLWGRDQQRVRAAVGLARAQTAELAQARLLLGNSVARTYFSLVAAQMQMQLAQDMVAKATTLLHLTQLRAKAGLSPQTPVHQNEIKLATARQNLAQLQGEVQILRDELASLAGQGPDWGRDLSISTSSAPDILALPENLPLQLLAHRPDITAARWRVEAARANVQDARAAFYPDINLKAFAGWDSIRLGDLLNPLNLAHALGPAIRLPVFEGGRLRANLGLQAAHYDAAVENYNSRLLHAVQQVADALAEWQATRDQLSAQTQSTQSTADNVHLAALRTASGMADRLQLLDAAYALDTERSKLAAQQASSLQAAVTLLIALGGGYHT